jgi:hypothetical protein
MAGPFSIKNVKILPSPSKILVPHLPLIPGISTQEQEGEKRSWAFLPGIGTFRECATAEMALPPQYQTI